MDSFKLFLESSDIEGLWRGLEQAAKELTFNSSDFNILADAIEEAGEDGAGLRWMAANNVWPTGVSLYWLWGNAENGWTAHDGGPGEYNRSGYRHWLLSEKTIDLLRKDKRCQRQMSGYSCTYFSSFRDAVEALLRLHPENMPRVIPEQGHVLPRYPEQQKQ